MKKLFIALFVIFLFALIFVPSGTKTAHADTNTLYWYGGTGSWNDGTTHWSNNSGNSPPSTHATPGLGNPVIFDNNSYSGNSQTCTINVAASCASFDAHLVNHNDSILGTFSLSIYGAYTGCSTLSWSGYSGTITFAATTSTSITSASSAFATAVTFNGVGGTWALQDAFSTTGTVTLTNGTLQTGNNAVGSGNFATAAGTSALTLGTMTWTGTGSWNMTAGTCTLTAGSSNITLTGAASQFTGGAKTYNEVDLTGSGAAAVLDTGNLFTNLGRTGTAVTTDTIVFSGNETILGTLTLTGNSVGNRIACKSNTTTARILTSAANSVTNCDFYYITAAGAASWDFHLNAGGCADMGGNTGITFSSPNYWVGGTGNWVSGAGSHWSGASGGTPHADFLPVSTSSATFDSNSFTGAGQSVTIDSSASCLNLNWAGGWGNNPTWAGSATLTIYGSLTTQAPANMSNTYTGTITFAATSGTKTITTNGLAFASAITFNGAGGTWQNADTFNDGSSTITLTNGTLDTNGQTITCGTFTTASGTNALTLGASVFNCTTWTATNLGTLTCGTSTIVFTGSGTFAGAGKTYYNWSDTAVGTPTISGSNTFTNLTRVGTAVTTDQITLPGGGTQTISGTLTLTGNSTTNRLLVYSSSSSQAALSVAIVTVTNCMLKYITGAGAGNWNLYGNGCVNYYDTSGVSDIKGRGTPVGLVGINLFISDAYWVGGAGNWDSTSVMHWAASSGGTPTDAAYPGFNTTVHFDLNSFSVGSNMVYCPNNNPSTYYNCYCWSMDWTGALYSPTLFINNTAYYYEYVHVYNNLTLIPSLTVSSNGYQGEVLAYIYLDTTFRPAIATGTIASSGGPVVSSADLGLNVVFYGNHTLADNFYTAGSIVVDSGTQTATNLSITAQSNFSFNATTSAKELDAGTGTTTCGSFTNSSTSSYLTITGTYTIVMNGSGTTFAGNGFTYYNVQLTGASPTITGTNTFNSLTDTGTAIKTESLVLSANQTIAGTLTISGNSPTNRVFVQSNTIGTQRTLTVGTTVSITHADFWDIVGAGIASWNLSSTDAGDEGANSGILFAAGVPEYWVGNSGSWSNVSQWANSPGGVPASGRVPIPQDTAYFVASSITIASRVVTVDMPRLSNINTSAVLNNPNINSSTTINVYKTLTLGGITWTTTSGTYLYNRADTFLTSGGTTLGANLYISAYLTTITLSDNLIITGALTLLKGTLATNAKNVTAATFDSSTTADTRSLDLSSGTFILNGVSAGDKWKVAIGGTFTLPVNTSTIYLTNSSGTSQNFTGGALTTYNNLTLAGAGACTYAILDSNTFNNFLVDRSQNTKTITFANSSTTTISGFDASPAAGTNICTLQNTSSNTIWTLSKSSGIIYADYLHIKYNVATGGASFYCGTNSQVLDGTCTNGTGSMTGSPVSLYEPSVTPTVTGAGNFTVLFGSTILHGQGQSGGWAVNPNPTTLNPGTTTLVVSAGGSGTITITATGSGWNASAPTPPSCTTTTATNVQATTAQLNGTLSSLGSYPNAYVSFQYGLTTSYGTSTTEQLETGTGAYSLVITGLSANTTYYYEAQVRYNVADYVYGPSTPAQQFTTTGAPTLVTGAATSITTTSAILQGTIIYIGIYPPIYAYFQWGLASPAYGNNTAQVTETSATGMSAAITGLSPGTLYHFEATAWYLGIGGATTYAYGGDATFMTSSATAPTVTTLTAVNVGTTTATIQGSLTSLGSYSSVLADFEWGLTSPAYGSNTPQQTLVSSGAFSSTISGLTPNTTYHFNAVTTYGGTSAADTDASFITLSSSAPSVTTNNPANVTGTTVTLQGTLTSLGSYSSVSVYFEIGTSTGVYPTTTSSQNATATGAFTQDITGLSQNTTYYYKAVVGYGGTTAAGAEVSFTTTGSGSPQPGTVAPDILSIIDTKVVTGYLATGDQMYLVSYKCLYLSGIPTSAASDYFDIELLNNGSIVGLWPLPSWGYRPVGLYLGPLSALPYGGLYTVEIIGIAGKWSISPPTVSRTLTTGDWLGSDLTNLDTWVITTAENMQTYDNTTYVTYTGSGTCLNSAGGAIFGQNISGLTTVRPQLFCTWAGYSIVVPHPGGTAYVQTWVVSQNLGPYINNLLIDGATDMNMSQDVFNNLIGILIFLATAIILLFACRGSFMGPLLATPVLVFISWGGLVAPVAIVLLAVVNVGLLVYALLPRGTG